ncbi:lactonase family protein, partial [bacterium]
SCRPLFGPTAACFPIQADGSLGEASWKFKNTAPVGPNKGRQDAPHMHCAVVDARSRHAYFCDLGTDEVLTFDFDNEKGTLAQLPSAKIAPGGGPRHLALHPSGRFAYVNHELDNRITAFAVDATTGGLSPLNTLSTVPPDWTHGGTSEIQVHPTGKWVYVSNRGHDSIAGYTIEDDGTLGEKVMLTDLGVKEPRGFDIDPTGNYMVVGGQGTDDVVVLKIDGQDGSLKTVSKIKDIAKPVCIMFARPGRH